MGLGILPGSLPPCLIHSLYGGLLGWTSPLDALKGVERASPLAMAL
jgi:hypothetical protein